MEQNEINMKEMLELLWGGRKLIAVITAGFILAGFILSFFVVPTMYSTSVYINPSIYKINNEDLLREAERMYVVETTARELAEKPRTMIRGTTIETSRDTRFIKITVDYPADQITHVASNKIGLAMLELARDYYAKQVQFEKENLEGLLAGLEEALDNYEEIDAPSGQPNSTVIILREQDPIKKQLLERKDDTILALKQVNFTLHELAVNPAWYPERWLFEEHYPSRANPVNKIVYLTITTILGLALSCFIVLVRQSVGGQAPPAEHSQAG